MDKGGAGKRAGGSFEALETRRGEGSKRAARSKKESVILWHEYDHTFFACVLVLLVFGVVMVLSSSYYIAMVSPKMTTFQIFFSQSRAVLLGLIIMVPAALFNYRYLGIFTVPMYVVANGLVVATKYIGVEVNGARRWIQVPILGQFQPSEVAKAALILLLAFYITGGKSGNRTKSLWGVLVCGLLTALPAVLVFKFNNNMSTAIIILAIGLGITFVACPYWKPMTVALGGLGGLALTAGWALVTFVTKEGQAFFRWAARIRASLNPWEDPQGDGFQTIQSLYAVASGGLVGLGLGQSNQKLKFMPEPQSDFIFAVICEELGFFGAALVLLLFGILIWRGAKVAWGATELLGCLIATGVVTQIAAQVIINVAVVTNTGINTGVPLPFISAGGTSVLVLMVMVGVLLNISRYSKDN